MPTLESIQGSSLQGGIDAVAAVREGAIAGRDLRHLQQEKGIDKTIAEGGKVAVAARKQKQQKDNVITAASKSGKVDPNAPTFDPIAQITAMQEKMMQFGQKGQAQAEKLEVVKEKALAKQLDAEKREAEAIGVVANQMKDVKKYEDRLALLPQLQANSRGDKAMALFIEEFKKADTLDKQNFYLNRMIGRATGVQKDIENKQAAQSAGIRQQEANTAAVNAATNKTDAEIARDNAQTRMDELEEDRLAREGKPQQEADIALVKQAQGQIEQAQETNLEATRILGTVSDIRRVLTQMGDPDTALANRLSIAKEIGKWSPQLGKDVADLLNTGDPGKAQQAEALINKNLMAIMESVPKPASDLDLMAARDSLVNMGNVDIETALRILGDQERAIMRTVRENLELQQLYDPEKAVESSRKVNEQHIKRGKRQIMMADMRSDLRSITDPSLRAEQKQAYIDALVGANMSEEDIFL